VGTHGSSRTIRAQAVLSTQVHDAEKVQNIVRYGLFLPFSARKPFPTRTLFQKTDIRRKTIMSRLEGERRR